MSAPVKSLIKCAGERGERLEGILSGKEHVFVLNLKCPPELSFALTSNFYGIVPAYHMNKRLWISVIEQSDVDEETLKKLITLSYDLTCSEGGKKQK